jgi:hypothetical protein
MPHCFRVLGAIAMIVVFSGSLSAAPVDISGVPFYPTCEGSGPSAAGMIIGYWDANGFPSLIPGTNDWSTNQAAIQNMIVSPEHVTDYVGYGTGLDRLDANPGGAPYHADNCLADFAWSSRGMVLADGKSFENKQISGLVGYANLMGYSGATGSWEYYGLVWDNLLESIDMDRPAEFFVASTASGVADHFVTVIGYDDAPGHLQYEFYDPTGSGEAQWADFTYLAAGQPWSVYSGTFFEIPTGVFIATPPEPATLGLLAVGLGLVARARRRRR